MRGWIPLFILCVLYLLHLIEYLTNRESLPIIANIYFYREWKIFGYTFWRSNSWVKFANEYTTGFCPMCDNSPVVCGYLLKQLASIGQSVLQSAILMRCNYFQAYLWHCPALFIHIFLTVPFIMIVYIFKISLFAFFFFWFHKVLEYIFFYL